MLHNCLYHFLNHTATFLLSLYFSFVFRVFFFVVYSHTCSCILGVRLHPVCMFYSMWWEFFCDPAMIIVPLLPDAAVIIIKFLKQQKFWGRRVWGCVHWCGQGVSASVWGLCPLSFPVLNGGWNRFWRHFSVDSHPPPTPSKNHNVWTACLNPIAGPPNLFIIHSVL